VIDNTWHHKACRATPAIVPEAEDEDENGPPHAVLAQQVRLWGSGNSQRTSIKYWFMDGHELQHKKVKLTIRIWQQYTFVSFDEAATIDESNIRISFDANDGSWSYVCTDSPHINMIEKTDVLL
jgi:hypothetical protein